MSEKEKKKGGEKDKPKFDFEEISRELAGMGERQHIDQIEASLLDVYLKHAKFKDAKGVERFKSKFSKDEATKLANGLYDALAYHAHRRVFGLDEAQYEALKKYKDPNGNPYIDTVTQYHFNLHRKDLVSHLAKEEKDNRIHHKDLQDLIQKPIKHHAELLNRGIISKHGLDEPEHMDAVKKAIDSIVDKYKLSKKEFDTKKMYSPQEVLGAYLKLSGEHYQEGAHEPEPKKGKK